MIEDNRLIPNKKIIIIIKNNLLTDHIKKMIIIREN